MKKGFMFITMFLCLYFFSSISVFSLPPVTTGLRLVEPSAGQAVFMDSGSTDVSYQFSINNQTNASTSVYTTAGSALEQGKTYYFRLNDDFMVDHASLQNDLLFDFKTETLSGNRYLDNVRLTNQSFTGGIAKPYIAITLREGVNITANRLTLNIYFQARQSGATWAAGNVFNAYFDLQVYQTTVLDASNDIQVNTNVTYQPESNADNAIYWQDNGSTIAALQFRTGSNPGSFNALLSTKINNNVYAKYGDPVGARLHFRTFSTNAVLSASRAVLLLMNPFTWDVSPTSVHIYAMNGNTLTDMTSQFTYDRNNNLWFINTRSLGSYVISDKALSGAIDSTTMVPSVGIVSNPSSPNSQNAGEATVRIVPLRYISSGSTSLQPTPPTGDKTYVFLATSLILVSLLAISLLIRLLYVKQRSNFAKK